MKTFGKLKIDLKLVTHAILINWWNRFEVSQSQSSVVTINHSENFISLRRYVAAVLITQERNVAGSSFFADKYVVQYIAANIRARATLSVAN